MISDLKIFPILLFETAELWCIVGLTAILRLLQRKNFTFPLPVFLLLLSERRLSPEKRLATCHLRASRL